MIPIVYINCSAAPFISDIIGGKKVYETRSRDTLRVFIGRRVLLAETGKHGRPVVRCSAVIDNAITCDRGAFQRLRHLHRVPRGSAYDWKPETKKKVLYRLVDVQPVTPFPAPEGVRHGRVWMEYENNGGI